MVRVFRMFMCMLHFIYQDLELATSDCVVKVQAAYIIPTNIGPNSRQLAH